MEEIFIALVPTEFSRIKIQTTVFLKEGKTYVNSVNIIYEGKILEKIKQENSKELKNLNPDKIASDYILNKLKIDLSIKNQLISMMRDIKTKYNQVYLETGLVDNALNCL